MPKLYERLDRMAICHDHCAMSIDATRSGTTLSERVAEEIRAAMGRRRITGAELARRLGVSPMWVSYRLAGRQEIGLTDLERIAGALDLAPVDLLPADITRRRETSQHYATAADRPRDNRPAGRPNHRVSTPGPSAAGSRRPRRIHRDHYPPAAEAA